MRQREGRKEVGGGTGEDWEGRWKRRRDGEEEEGRWKGEDGGRRGLSMRDEVGRE